MPSFSSLGLVEPLVRAASERRYDQPTDIQSAAIPAVLAGRDLIACARTGSGKTAAFALPLLQQAEALPAGTRSPQALVLVPTRDLATQVGEEIRDLARHLSRAVKVVTAFGGVSINPQMMRLRGGADVVVATPGRLLDLVAHNALRLDGTALLVLDEADRLLDAGFADELHRVLSMLPGLRQTLLFSATFAPPVHALAQALLRDPLRIDVPGDPPDVSGIAQRALRVDAARRTPLLRHLLAEQRWSRVLVFVATQYATQHVAAKLAQHGVAAAAFNGDLSQGARTKVLADFKAGRLQVVVATDVVARGIDIADLPVVLNYDLPRSTADYVHRIGRTGRAGRGGLAVSFVTAEGEPHFRLIEKRQGLRVPREQVAGFEPTEAEPPPTSGGIKGRRKSRKDKLREAAARSTR